MNAPAADATVQSVVRPQEISPRPSPEVFRRITALANRRDVSPLRYPGGKRKLALLIAHIVATAKEPVRLFVEPFAGGASVAIAMLESGMVQEIALADRDDLVASFWKTVFSPNAEHLARRIERADVTLAERDRLLKSRPRSDAGRAYKCLFLNRTSFSGILNERAGAIGGRAQTGEYTVGCRFNRERLAERIRQLSGLRAWVRFAKCQDYSDTIREVRALIENGLAAASICWYLDPPFFEKADRLYRHVFDSEGHRAFRRCLDTLPGSFVLSYDDVPAAEELYGTDLRAMAVPMGRTSIAMTYAAAENLREAKELIVSNLLVEPGTKISVHNRSRFANAKKARSGS